MQWLHYPCTDLQILFCFPLLAEASAHAVELIPFLWNNSLEGKTTPPPEVQSYNLQLQYQIAMAHGNRDKVKQTRYINSPIVIILFIL